MSLVNLGTETLKLYLFLNTMRFLVTVLGYIKNTVPLELYSQSSSYILILLLSKPITLTDVKSVRVIYCKTFTSVYNTCNFISSDCTYIDIIDIYTL